MKEHKAIVKVASDKLSLAIGKSGQNVRLAAHLTGWKIDIIEDGVGKVVDSEDQSWLRALRKRLMLTPKKLLILKN